MKDYYSILGVPREAEVELIKATYLALSKIYHPDVYKGDKILLKKECKILMKLMRFYLMQKKKRI